MTTDLDYHAFDALTFDCYGTLIDWEAGILAGLRTALRPHGADAPDGDLLEKFAKTEATLESGPYLRYREILGLSADAIGRDLGVAIGAKDTATFGGSVADWPAFPDSHDAGCSQDPIPARRPDELR